MMPKRGRTPKRKKDIHWGLGITSTDTEVSLYPHKGGGLLIRSTDTETLTLVRISR